MAYKCPRCNVHQVTAKRSYIGGGLIGLVIMFALTAYECRQCGPIPRADFPDDIRQSMFLKSTALMIGGIVALVALVAVVVMATVEM